MRKFIFFSAIALWLFAATGCDKEDEQIWEIYPDRQQTVIEHKMNGIVFKFRLLNEQGKPATVFKEGENFTFSLSLNNITHSDISVSTDFINDNFYRVYRKYNTDMGIPWTGIWCEFNQKPKEIEIASSMTKQFNCPWKLTNDTRPDYPFCMSKSREVLTKGDYYTVIHTDFKYITNKKQFIENIHFKINFKIE